MKKRSIKNVTCSSQNTMCPLGLWARWDLYNSVALLGIIKNPPAGYIFKEATHWWEDTTEDQDFHKRRDHFPEKTVHQMQDTNGCNDFH
jgi:hypothetical protein